MSRLLATLPDDVRGHIRGYASDKTLHRQREANLISSLNFWISRPDEFYWFSKYQNTIVVAAAPDYFIKRDPLTSRPSDPEFMRFIHNQFDERNFPQHFDISLTWDNLRQQDEIEAMGNEDTRLFPEGLPASVEPQDTPIKQTLQRSRAGEGKWVYTPQMD